MAGLWYNKKMAFKFNLWQSKRDKERLEQKYGENAPAIERHSHLAPKPPKKKQTDAKHSFEDLSGKTFEVKVYPRKYQ